MPSVVNIASLQLANETYQSDFRVLPYATLIPVLQEMRISMLEVNNKDIVVVQERKGGATRPYKPGTINYVDEITKMTERPLQVHTAVTVIKDNIQNYKEKRVLFDAGKNKINNQTGKHPLEREIISNQIKTTAEDIIDSMFHGTYNVDDQSPMGVVDGYNKIIDDMIVAGEVSNAKGNLVACGDLKAPTSASDVSAFINLRNWLRNIDPKAKKEEMMLYIPSNSLINVKDALENKKTSYKDVNFAALLTQLREDCDIPKLQIVSHYCLGIGDRLMLTQPGNFELGMNTVSDLDFVDIRGIFEDRNLVQFWLQYEIGSRIQKLHRSAFMVSDGTVTANPLSGDYRDASASV